MFDKIRGILKLWELEKEATKEIKMETEIKPGYKTTEFWLTLLAQAPSIIGLILGSSNPATVWIGPACIIAYNIMRATSKTQVAKAVILAGISAAADAAKTAQANITKETVAVVVDAKS